MTNIRAIPKVLAICAALLVGVLSAAPAEAGFEDGVRAYLAQDYAAALNVWRPLAEEGHAPAQFGMGLSYENGRGVERDPTQAAVWYHKAAEQGLADAQFNLGNLYLEIYLKPFELCRFYFEIRTSGLVCLSKLSGHLFCSMPRRIKTLIQQLQLLVKSYCLVNISVGITT